MGWGDELIASGQAREAHAANGQRVIIRDRFGRIRSHEAWIGNEKIVGVNERVTNKVTEIVNGPGVRPYIKAKNDRFWVWRDWTCPVGEIFLTDEERRFASGRIAPDILIEPSVKQKASPNKSWGRDRWQALAKLLSASGFQPCQIGPAGTQRLEGVEMIETPTFRYAAAVLARARAAVLPEGGLHHAAAALGVKTVVIFGGYISPRQTGYASQRNLFTGVKPCGMRIPCQHCADAMAKITPEIVVAELKACLA